MKHYIDLFDDALYQVSAIGSEDVPTEQLKNTIRLQVLISLLFRNQIIVPEQWALSSATFLQVANEVIDGYQRKIVLRDRASPEKALIKPPIVVSFRQRDVSAPSAFSLAMAERLDIGSRLMFSSVTGDSGNDRYQVSRRVLRDLFVDKTDAFEPSQFDCRFEDRVADVIQDDNMACNIRGLCAYLAMYSDPDFKLGQRSAIEFHDIAQYTSNMSEHASTVRTVCNIDEILLNSDDSRVGEFKEMFDRAERDKIPISSFMDMWEIAKDYPKPTFDLITRMGAILSASLDSGCDARGFQFNVLWRL